MTTVAKLGTYSLPTQFSYRPYVPRKRTSVTATAGAVIIQYSLPTQIVHGDGILPWTIPGAYPSEFQSLFNLYNTTTPTMYTFLGYWEESLGVYFHALDQPSVRGRLFDLSGSFQVICVNDYTNATC